MVFAWQGVAGDSLLGLFSAVMDKEGAEGEVQVVEVQVLGLEWIPAWLKLASLTKVPVEKWCTAMQILQLESIG